VPTLIAIDRDGQTHHIDGDVGATLMSVLKYNGDLDVAADCGGFAVCGTCHIHVAASWLDRLPPLSEDEEMVLEGLLHRQADSRLACQNHLTEDLDGLTVTLAEAE
jgi:ferredoxin, 2Fe-2S